MLTSVPNSLVIKRKLYDAHMLTQMMRDSFGGNSRALMLVTISPSVWDVPQTVLTLNFAKMTGLVKNRSGHLEIKSEPIANTQPKQKSEFDEAWDSIYYIEFLPEG